jgi:hypothetical protein
MLDLVVRALQSAKTIDDIYVVGDVPDSGEYTRIPPRGDLFQNLTAGIEATGPSDGRHILVSTSDIPFLTPQSVDDFVDQSLHRNAQICYPIVPMEVYNERFAAMKRTTLKTREGRFTGGNLMLLDGAFISRHGEHIRQAYAARKDVRKLGKLLGVGIFFKLILSQTIAPNAISVPELEHAVSRLLSGARVAAIPTNYAEIGTDVDKISDVEYVRQHFSA